MIPPDRFEEPKLTADGWSPKDAMFHVAAWCAEAANQLERMRLGTYVDPMIDTEVQNREWFEISRDLDVSHRHRRDPRRSDQDAARSGASSASTASPTPDAIEWFEESGHIHYRGHRARAPDVAGGELSVGLGRSVGDRP